MGRTRLPYRRMATCSGPGWCWRASLLPVPRIPRDPAGVVEVAVAAVRAVEARAVEEQAGGPAEVKVARREAAQVVAKEAHREEQAAAVDGRSIQITTTI